MFSNKPKEVLLTSAPQWTQRQQQRLHHPLHKRQLKEQRKINAKNPRKRVYVLDFDGDLYGERVSVTFEHFLRSERKFDGLEAIKTQLQLDVAAARLALL